MLNFREFNDLVARKVIHPKDRAIIELFNKIQGLVYAEQNLPQDYARLYSVVQLLKYAEDGTPTDVTSSDQLTVPMNVLSNAIQNLQAKKDQALALVNLINSSPESGIKITAGAMQSVFTVAGFRFDVDFESQSVSIQYIKPSNNNSTRLTVPIQTSYTGESELVVAQFKLISPNKANLLHIVFTVPRGSVSVNNDYFATATMYLAFRPYSKINIWASTYIPYDAKVDLVGSDANITIGPWQFTINKDVNSDEHQYSTSIDLGTASKTISRYTSYIGSLPNKPVMLHRSPDLTQTAATSVTSADAFTMTMEPISYAVGEIGNVNIDEYLPDDLITEINNLIET